MQKECQIKVTKRKQKEYQVKVATLLKAEKCQIKVTKRKQKEYQVKVEALLKAERMSD